MGLFVTSVSAARRHGVFAIDRAPPRTITAIGTGKAAMVGQFPWGPSQTLVRPSSRADLLNTMAPAGMTRTGSAYLMLIAAAFPTLYTVRVLGPTAATATATLTSAGPTNLITLTAKYPGTEGNAIVATVSNASDGDSNHFNLQVTVSGASGSTTDSVDNLNYSGVGSDSVVNLTSARLLGAITKIASGRPTNGTYVFSGGTNGTVDAAAYKGTEGTGDKGLAKLEGDKTIRGVFVDDCGNTDRNAVNLGLRAHATYMGDRVAYINGNSGLSASAVLTDVANYRSVNVCYVDAWAYIYDDVDSTKRLIPPSVFAASVATQLSPTTSIAWKDEKVRSMLNQIVELETDRGDNAATNTAAGITTLVPYQEGGFCFEAGKVTELTPGKTNLTRSRFLHYSASSIVASLGSAVDAPNVPLNQQDIVNAIDAFHEGLKKNKSVDPNNAPYIVDFQITDIATSNDQASIDAGKFIVEANVKLGSSMEQIFYSVSAGETVSITAE